MKDIVDTLTTDGSFKTLLSLLELAGMTDRFRQPGPFTLFAPNDAAFQRVNLDEITKDKGNLVSLLSYHFIPETLTSPEIAKHQHLVTESGKSLSVSLEEGRQVIDNAKYVANDITCSNGIVQVIDNVFLPQFSGWYCGGCC